MDADNRMLAELQSHSPVVLRMYRWSSPTLSLGHFQDEEEIPAEERWSTAPRVRRKTGGGAILHDLEWTYSLVIPSRPELGLKGHSEAIYRSTHLAIVNGLREMGWDAKLSEQCTCSAAGTRKVSQAEPFLCFMRRSPVDVLIGQDKILGSAQRRSAAGLLQHGSFLLSASALTPSLHGLFDQTRNSSDASGLESEDAGKGADADWVRASVPSDANSIVDFAWRFWGEWLAERLRAGIDQVIACKWDDARFPD
ncbi:Octanoyltransferase LipM [Pirellula sp. SH-Sr6A]|nr:Octanoyltransferase LipM [Pirellula sp. SH-Sr6A]